MRLDALREHDCAGVQRDAMHARSRTLTVLETFIVIQAIEMKLADGIHVLCNRCQLAFVGLRGKGWNRQETC